MPAVWKRKKTTKRSSWGPFRWTRVERPWRPDRITSVTIPNPNVLRGGRVTIWEAAPRCPKCDKLATPEGKCPRAPGRRKWCDG